MSTRCNIKVKDDSDELIFYRHSDGYPNGARPLLDKFMQAVADGKIRDNTSQACGWLIVLGHSEYKVPDEPSWKVGAIEPTACIHSDIAYLYELDLRNLTITTFQVDINPDMELGKPGYQTFKKVGRVKKFKRTARVA